MPATTFIGHFLGPDIHANRPAATGLPNGTLYVCTTHSKIERVVAGAWVDYATLGVPAGTAIVATDPIWDTKGDLAVASGPDAAAKLPVGTNNQVLTADSAQTLGVKWATPAAPAATALTLLSTTTLASDGTFDITSIAGTYNDLILVLIARDTSGVSSSSPELKFNADGGANYYSERYTVTGSTAPASAEAVGGAFAQIGAVPAATAAAGHFGSIEITVYGYASTAWRKTYQARSFYSIGVASGNFNIRAASGLWNSTAAINRIGITGTGGVNLLAGSQLRIYGRT